jgi:hypothetical protein
VYTGLGYFRSQLYTVPPCLTGGEWRVICPTISEETADRGGRGEDAVFPLVSMEGETMRAKEFLILDMR